MDEDVRTALALAERQGGVVTREQARACGCGEARIRRLLHSGQWVSLRRGALAPADVVADPHRRLLADAAAVWLALGRRPVLSHGTAALVHDLLLPLPPSRAELTAEPHVLRWRQGDGFRLSAATLPSHHRTAVAGLPVTTVARTVVDLARWLPHRRAVMLTDDALHRALVHRAELDRVLIDCAVWPRIRRAALAVAASDGRAESPLETVCRLVFARHGLPGPDLQAVIVDERDGWWARVDFLWAPRRTVVEADGMVKYASGEDLRAEKLRQERIEELGYVVLRVTWAQVTREPQATVARVLRAFARGALLARGSPSPS
ncbi:MAG: type IV toxin-antitoxin system AbiEi family antitoxin domain-containing protein [Mycobacteriales bacterium]